MTAKVFQHAFALVKLLQEVKTKVDVIKLPYVTLLGQNKYITLQHKVAKWPRHAFLGLWLLKVLQSPLAALLLFRSLDLITKQWSFGSLESSLLPKLTPFISSSAVYFHFFNVKTWNYMYPFRDWRLWVKTWQTSYFNPDMFLVYHSLEFTEVASVLQSMHWLVDLWYSARLLRTASVLLRPGQLFLVYAWSGDKLPKTMMTSMLQWAWNRILQMKFCHASGSSSWLH